MAYITRARIEARIDAKLLIEALDDDEDGQIDVDKLEELLEAASDEVDGLLGKTAPFTNPSAAVKNAAFIFACEMIFDRRSQTRGSDKNPMFKKAEEQRAFLRSVARGEANLDESTGSGSAALVENTSTLPQRSDFDSL